MISTNADVKRAFLKLVEEKERGHLPPPGAQLQDPRLVRQGQHCAGFHAGILGAAEGFTLLSDPLHFTDSIERMERAYDDWKAGRWSADPFLDMVIPTTLDPTMAPPGKHFMSCFVQYTRRRSRARMDRC